MQADAIYHKSLSRVILLPDIEGLGQMINHEKMKISKPLMGFKKAIIQ